MKKAGSWSYEVDQTLSSQEPAMSIGGRMPVELEIDKLYNSLTAPNQVG
jgi:hypothetical protein